MMDTILNLGLNDQVVEGLAELQAIRDLHMTAIEDSSKCFRMW